MSTYLEIDIMPASVILKIDLKMQLSLHFTDIQTRAVLFDELFANET